MVGGKRSKQLIGRYDVREVGAAVDKTRRQANRTVKECCDAIQCQKWDWSRKARGVGSQFTVEELGVLADLFDAPPGWPLLSPDVARALLPAHKPSE